MIILSKVFFGCVALTASFSLLAQDAKPTAANPPSPPQPSVVSRMGQPANRPQGGKLVTVDKKAQTMTVAPMPGPISTLTSNTVVHFTTNTIFVKAGKRVTPDDLTPDVPVRYQIRKTPEGTDMATVVMIVTAPPPRTLPVVPPPPPAPKNK